MAFQEIGEGVLSLKKGKYDDGKYDDRKPGEKTVS